VGARFSAPVLTGPGSHPVFYTARTGSFPRVKRPVHGVNQPSLSSAEVKERVELYLYSPSGPSWPVVGRNLFRWGECSNSLEYGKQSEHRMKTLS
jgi:hypothetical protein